MAEEDSEELRDPANSGMLEDVCRVFNDNLSGLYPEAARLSPEEVCNMIDLGDSPGGKGKHWVLDPIDGTRGFEAGRQYSVCLGLIDDGEPVLGVCDLNRIFRMNHFTSRAPRQSSHAVPWMITTMKFCTGTRMP